jgi:hypothetical protein
MRSRLNKKARTALPLLLLGLVLAVSLTGGSFSRGRFYLHGDGFSADEAGLVMDTLENAERLLSGIYNYIPAENLDIIVLSGVWEMKTSFGVGPWVGAYYTGFKTYLQPITTLKKREVLARVLFIEYAHYYLDSYTNRTCPAWFNELCSYYLFRLYTGAPPVPAAPAAGVSFRRYADFIDLSANMRDYDRLESFYYYAVRFVLFLQERHRLNACLDLVKAMHRGISFKDAVTQAAGKSPARLFEEEFLAWPAAK